VRRDSLPQSAKWLRPAVAVVAVGMLAAAITTVALAHRAATPASVVGSPSAGATPFKSSCGGCHTLAAAGSTGTVGPNLNTVTLSEATIIKAITNGGATVMTPAQVKMYAATMPAFKTAFSATEIENIAAYVYTSVASATTVSVGISDTKFTLKPTKLAVGKITFDLKNSGKKPHNFSINGKTSATVAPGKTGSLAVSFAKAGSYPYKSTVKGDTLKGSFTVTAAASTTTTSKTTTPPTTTSSSTGGGTTAPPTTTTSGGGGAAAIDNCPAGVTIITSGITDNDQDENGSPSDGDGCL